MDRIWHTEGEIERLAACALEPIRTPGSIQAHGALLVFDPGSLEIIQASENCLEILGLGAAVLLGSPISELVGDEAVSSMIAVLRQDVGDANPNQVSINGRAFDVIAHGVDGRVVAEFEPVLPVGLFPPPATVYGAAHRLASLNTVDALMRQTALEMREITGYDRVMVYRFHDDGHGEVVAESRVETMEPYLGLHYPASDIPAQARLLYLTKLSRVIASNEEEPAQLLALPDAVGIVTDLSTAELRSVSPHHLEFMRNMGQSSTVSFSLVHDGQLIGMITCAHRTPRRLPYLMRRSLELVAVQVALHLGSMVQVEVLARELRARELRARLVTQFTRTTDLSTALFFGETTALDLVPADGALLVHDGVIVSTGVVPESTALDALVAGIGSGSLMTSALSEEHPGIAALLPGVAGILALPVGGQGDLIIWFRRDVAMSVDWLGDMTSDNRDSPLSPRTSFSAWKQHVEGQSAPWGDGAYDAAQLCSDLDSALLVRAESVLAAMAFHDPLTGLPNRRLLMDRLNHSLAKYARGEEVCVLFVDLDRFKSVNDQLGHDAGDAVLTEVANRIVGATRVSDTVARLGGDEFVVLCENTTAEEADIVARRILLAVATPIPTDDAVAQVTASIGVAPANLSRSAVELLRSADSAMYRAKASGRGRTSR